MFTRSDVARVVGPEAFGRGEDYAHRGRVTSVERDDESSSIVGHVRGSGRNQYVTVVEMSGEGERATPQDGHCSCPVQLNCKHVAAVLLAYLEQEQPAVATGPGRASRETRVEWEQLFAPLLDASAGGRDVRPVAQAPRRTDSWGRYISDEVALQVELVPAVAPRATSGRASRAGAASLPRLAMRPVIRGAGGRWVRTGATWGDLSYLGHRQGRFPDGHLDVLRSLYGLASSVGDARYYSAPSVVHPDELPSSALWALLADARRVGLPIIQADKAQTPLVIGSARTELTVSRTPAGLALEAHIVLDDVASDLQPTAPQPTAPQPTDQQWKVLLGTPAAGLYSWRGPLSPTKENPVRLAQLATPLDDTARSLLTRSAPLDIPADDEQRFLSRVYPAVSGSFDTVLLDAAITLPERPRPGLWLDVARLPGHGARLSWQWRYATGDTPAAPDVLTVPLGVVPDGPLRDIEAETDILERVAARCPRLLGLLRDDLERTRADPHGPAVVARARTGVVPQELRGVDTALFFTEELPGLTELAAAEPDFDIEVRDADVHEGGAPGAGMRGAGVLGAAVEYRLEPDVEVTVATSPREDSRDWFDLAVTVRAGEQDVPFAELFRALAVGETHMLLADGLHFALDDERFTRLRELIVEARALQDTMGGTLRVNRFQAGMFDELERLGVLGGQAEDWRAALGALAGGGHVEPVEQPAGLLAQMRSYQQEGFEWLVFLHRHGLGGVLADDMGLGKTLQALALVQHTRADEVPDAPPGSGPGVRRPPFLVVAPTSVVGNWAAEVRHFTPDLTAVTIHETRARRRTALAEVVAGADIVVTSYALFRLDFEEYDALEWSGLILDEAQFVKNHQSVAYQCARRLAAPFKLAMTGTPLENNLMELWSIISVVSPGVFPHPGQFAEYYQRPIEKDGDEVRLAQLRRRVAPFMLRRTKEHVAKDLPAKQEQVMDVTLNPRHRKVYDQYLQRERTKVLGLVEDFNDHRFEVFRSLAVLRQASLDVSLVDDKHAGIPSSKLEVLFEMLDDVLAEGHSVLVFSQFTQFLRRVRDRLDAGKVDYSYLDGRTRKRAETIERFTSGETKVFLISLKAGGFGLNLTAADYCILLDPWWNPAAEAQAVDRAHRIGQERNVMVYRLVSENTIEEKVMALKESKSKLVASVLDGGGAGGGGLTASDVRELMG